MQRGEDACSGGAIACASASVRVSATRANAACSVRRARASMMVLAMKIVQVASEAKPRLIITALTTMSAARNIDQGDSSCGRIGAEPERARRAAHGHELDASAKARPTA